MDSALINDIGLFVLRASVAYVYLHGAWMIAGTAERRRLTADRSTVLLDNTPLSGNIAIGQLLGAGASIFMLAGSLALILGIGTRFGAVLLILFTIPGIIVHLRELAQSVGLVDTVAAHSGGEPADILAKLRWSAYAGHRSSANKNYALIGTAVYLVLCTDPNGQLSLSAALGI